MVLCRHLQSFIPLGGYIQIASICVDRSCFPVNISGYIASDSYTFVCNDNVKGSFLGQCSGSINYSAGVISSFSINYSGSLNLNISYVYNNSNNIIYNSNIWLVPIFASQTFYNGYFWNIFNSSNFQLYSGTALICSLNGPFGSNS